MLSESDGRGNPLDIPMDKDCSEQRGSDSERNSPKRKNKSWSVAEHQPKGKSPHLKCLHASSVLSAHFV